MQSVLHLQRLLPEPFVRRQVFFPHTVGFSSSREVIPQHCVSMSVVDIPGSDLILWLVDLATSALTEDGTSVQYESALYEADGTDKIQLTNHLY